MDRHGQFENASSSLAKKTLDVMSILYITTVYSNYITLQQRVMTRLEEGQLTSSRDPMSFESPLRFQISVCQPILEPTRIGRLGRFCAFFESCRVITLFSSISTLVIFGMFLSRFFLYDF